MSQIALPKKKVEVLGRQMAYHERDIERDIPVGLLMPGYRVLYVQRLTQLLRTSPVIGTIP